MDVFVGTYTTDASSEGIYPCHLDPVSGELRVLPPFPAGDNPSFVAIHPSGRFLYAVNEKGCDDTGCLGAVSAFELRGETEPPRTLGRTPSHGADPCHLAVLGSGRFVAVANYSGGGVAILPVAPDGSLGDPTACVQHAGRGPIPDRQDRPHAHSTMPSPGGAFLFVVDLGLDRVMVYRFDDRRGALAPNDPPFAGSNGGAGPRHIALHPSGRWAYVSNELDSTVSAYRLDDGRGILERFQDVPTLPAGFRGTNHTADIHVVPEGRFLYVSNRGHDSIAGFAINGDDGGLAPIGHTPCGGRTPRSFLVAPSGAFILVANQDTNTIVVLERDLADGHLSGPIASVDVPHPACLAVRSGREG